MVELDRCPIHDDPNKEQFTDEDKEWIDSSINKMRVAGYSDKRIDAVIKTYIWPV